MSPLVNCFGRTQILRVSILLGAAMLLAACSHVQAVGGPEERLIDDQVARLTASYNQQHHKHYPQPRVVIQPFPGQATIVGAANYSSWTILLNPEWVQDDLCVVYKEALAHELAHLFVYYDRYGPPRVAWLETPRGVRFVPLNGPLLEDDASEHGVDWRAVVRALGADPCKQGYCDDARPYRRYPPACPGLDQLLAAYEHGADGNASRPGGAT